MSVRSFARSDEDLSPHDRGGLERACSGNPDRYPRRRMSRAGADRERDSHHWVYQYKPRGLDPRTGKRPATQSLTLGNPESLSPEAARTKAFELRARRRPGSIPPPSEGALVKVVEQRSRTVDGSSRSTASPSPPGDGSAAPALFPLRSRRRKSRMSAPRSRRSPPAKSRSRPSPRRCAPLARRRSHGRTRPARFNALRRFFDIARRRLVGTILALAIPKARRPRPPASRANVCRSHNARPMAGRQLPAPGVA